MGRDAEGVGNYVSHEPSSDRQEIAVAGAVACCVALAAILAVLVGRYWNCAGESHDPQPTPAEHSVMVDQ